MARPHSLSITGAVIVCLVTIQGSGTLSASQDDRLSSEAVTSHPPLGPIAQSAQLATFNLARARSDAFAEQVYQGRPYPMGHDRSIAAIMIGAVAAITGAAVLVYANRPECATRQFAGGCGYGTRVIGGAVLTGGIVALAIGALTWR